MKLRQSAAILFTGLAASLLPIAPSYATQGDSNTYARIAEATIKLREKDNIAQSAPTPDAMVNQVLEEEYSNGTGTVFRDSGQDYGTNIGRNEAAACATNPYDCARAKSAINDARRISGEKFPSPESNDNIQDADRHCIWQALTTIRANADFAAKIGDAHEKDHPGTPEAGRMDQANNATGREIGLRHEGNEQGAIDECHAKAERGELAILK